MSMCMYSSSRYFIASVTCSNSSCIEVIEALQSASSPDKPVETRKEQKTTSSEKDSHKDAPPKMTLPDHPACMLHVVCMHNNNTTLLQYC